jgi:hypothetical protein
LEGLRRDEKFSMLRDGSYKVRAFRFFEGKLGIQVAADSMQRLRVSSVAPGAQGQALGIKEGDVVLGVNGLSIEKCLSRRMRDSHDVDSFSAYLQTQKRPLSLNILVQHEAGAALRDTRVTTRAPAREYMNEVQQSTAEVGSPPTAVFGQMVTQMQMMQMQIMQMQQQLEQLRVVQGQEQLGSPHGINSPPGINSPNRLQVHAPVPMQGLNGAPAQRQQWTLFPSFQCCKNASDIEQEQSGDVNMHRLTPPGSANGVPEYRHRARFHPTDPTRISASASPLGAQPSP